jgi:hypothetical protein
MPDRKINMRAAEAVRVGLDEHLWPVVVDLFPECTSGDVDPGWVAEYDDVCGRLTTLVEQWARGNGAGEAREEIQRADPNFPHMSKAWGYGS